MGTENVTLFDLGLPAREEFDRVMDALSPEARVRFYTEVVDALYEVQGSGSAAPLRNAAQAWYRSAVFHAQPGFAERLDTADADAKRLVGQ